MLLSIRCLPWAALVTLIALAPAGCDSGPAKCYIEGTVTFQGKPVTDCHVVFFAPSVGGGSAPLDANGAFQISGHVPAGDYLVTFATPAPAPGEAQVAAPPPKVPNKYRHEKTTDLRVKVVGGKNKLALDLTP